ncbi:MULTISPECIES: hypothetical protein [Cupriavidus]
MSNEDRNSRNERVAETPARDVLAGYGAAPADSQVEATAAIIAAHLLGQPQRDDVEWVSRLIRAMLAASPAAQHQSEPIAWVHEEDPSRAISALQKAGMLRDGGAGASSVRPYSIAAFEHAAPQPSAKALDVEAIMTKVQEFASAWAVAGGRFDDGTAMDRAEECRAELRALLAAEQPGTTFQSRVEPWMLACFGAEIAADTEERNHRFLEEALELVQACGATASEAHQLVDYVYGRPVGDKHQEVGGVMVTLAALCLAQGLDMHAAGETELARIWTKVEQIRAKQAAKPKHSPLPQHVAEQPSEDERDAAARTLERLGYTYHGAELWEPPIGSAATELPRHALEAWRAVVRERRRQIAEEGWTPEHDDEHAEGQLAQAAATYAAAAALDGPDASVMQDLGARGTPHHILAMWPWDLEWWKPKDRRRNLERAGALILAELEHLIRAERKEGA